MTIDRMILAIAGGFVLIGALLSVVYHPGWIWFATSVGANLLPYAFAGFCPMAVVPTMVGLKPGQAFS